MRCLFQVICQLILIWDNDYLVISLVEVPEKDVYREHGWGNWASSYSASRHARWSAIYSEIFANWNQPFQAKSRVVTVITTTPHRIADIKVVIDSLLQQSYPADTVYVFVPHVFGRDGARYNIPAWLEEYDAQSKVSLVRCADRGPGTDVLSALELETDPETFIFKVDDDQVYGKDTLNLLLRSAAIMPGRAISADSTQYYPHTNGVILQGVHGMIFQRKLFDNTIFDYSVAQNWSRNCWLHDDLWYSMHFAKKGIRRESLEMRMETRALELAWSSSALYLGGAGTDNYQNIYFCNAAVLQVYPQLWQPRYRIVLITSRTAGVSMEQLIEWISSQSRRPHHVHAFGFPTDAKEQRFGDWMEGFVVTSYSLEKCGKCDAGGILEAIMDIEEETETVLIAASAKAFQLPDAIEKSVACVTKSSLLEVPADCSIPAVGLMAFWRGCIGAGSYLANITQSIFDEPSVPGGPPAVAWEQVHDLGDDYDSVLEPGRIEEWRASALLLDGRKPSFVIVIHTPVEDLQEAQIMGSALLYHAPLPPDRIYVCLQTSPGITYATKESVDPLVTLLEFQTPIESLEEVCRLECPHAFILSMPVQRINSGILHLFASLAILKRGFAIASHAIRYRDVAPILSGTVMYPPGLLDITLSQEGRKECKGAEDLWLWLHLNARGAQGFAMGPDFASKITAQRKPSAPPDLVWQQCFDFLWPKLGLRLNPLVPRRRVALFLRPPATSALNVLSKEQRPVFVKHWADLDVVYLLSQQRYPDIVYILDDGSLHGHSTSWVGGINGFSVRLLPCAGCTDFEQLKAAMSSEWHPNTLLLFATAERLLSDMLVLENLRCAQRMLRLDTQRYCGYPMHKMANHRLMEMAMLRGQMDSF